MSFDDILNITPDEKESLIQQALKKQEYNRNYQRRLRQAAKLATLEKRIDDNLDHVLGYIKTRYSKDYEAWKPRTKAVEFSNPAFTNWLLLTSNEHKSAEDAYGVSGLNNEKAIGYMSFEEFSKLFNQHYKLEDDNKYHKITP